MTKETAFSLQLGRPITALEANDLALKGILKDRHAFQCSEQCKVPYTCANFKTIANERKKAPYFVCGNQDAVHDENCSVGIEISKNNQSKLNKTELKNSGNFRLNLSDNGFNPIANNYIKTSSKAISNSYYDNVNEDIKNNKSTKVIHSNINSLRKLVSLYYSDEYNNKSTVLSIDNTSTVLDDLFVNMSETSILPGDTKVFHGKFWVNDNIHSFKFTSESKYTYINNQNRISFFLNKEYLEQKILDKLIQSINKIVYVYCYAKIVEKEYTTEDKKIIYLNFYFRNNINNLLFDFNI